MKSAVPRPAVAPAGARPARRKVVSWKRGSGRRDGVDLLSPEEPLEIRVDTHPVTVTMRTPGHDQELAVGFLVSEGVLTGADQIAAIRPYGRNRHGNVIDLHLHPDVKVNFRQLTRHVFASSSCGLCGKATIEAVQRQFPPLRRKVRCRAEDLLRLPGRMRKAQDLFQRTGGVHAAALFDARGTLQVLREDVGRHNAVDKVVGHALLQRRDPADLLMVSGRASFEIVQKAAAARIAIVAAVSAPSSLAVEFARQSGQTLVGFLRGDGFNVYAGHGRIGLEG